MNVGRMLVRGVLVAGVVAAVLGVPGTASADTGSSWTVSRPEPGESGWTVTDLGGAPVSPAPVVASDRRVRAGRADTRRRVGSGYRGTVRTNAGRVWWVRRGDTLGLVAACVRVPVPRLAERNALVDPDLILTGQALLIPARTP